MIQYSANVKCLLYPETVLGAGSWILNKDPCPHETFTVVSAVILELFFHSIIVLEVYSFSYIKMHLGHFKWCINVATSHVI